MNTQNLISRTADYNVWANEQLVAWLSTKEDEILGREIPSSFSGLLKTLNHIWAIEAYWYAILTGTEDTENRYGAVDLNREEVFAGIINRSKLLAEKVQSMSEAELDEKLKLVTPWFEGNLSRAEYILHLVNHSTYHRGQLVTIGRNAGLTDIPGTDYVFFSVTQAQSA